MIATSNEPVTNTTAEKLKASHLFENFTIDGILKLFEAIPTQQVLLNEGDTLYSPYQSETSTGFLLDGSLQQYKKLKSGSTVRFTDIKPVEMIDAQSVFSKLNTGTAYLTASSPSRILFITKANLSRLFNKDKRLLYYYMEIISSQAFRMTEQIEEASFLSLQKRVGLFLQASMRKYLSAEIHMPYTLDNWADQLHTTPEALLKTLENMEADGILTINDDFLHVINPERL